MFVSGVPIRLVPSASGESRPRFCVIAGLVAIALALAGCGSTGIGSKPPAPPYPGDAKGVTDLQRQTDRSGFLALPSMGTPGTPIRAALLLPLSHPSPDTRAVAEAIAKAAELALFDTGDAQIMLMPRDDGANPAAAAAAAERAIVEGAEIILGPLFSQSVAAVAPIARARGVPVIGFSSDRAVGGEGVYLLSFQPEDEVRRIVAYAAGRGRSNFAALVPRTAYGDKVAAAFRQSVSERGGIVATVAVFTPAPESIGAPAAEAAAAHPDAILIAEGGVLLRGLAPTLALHGASNRRVKFLGTGLWDDPSILREPMLAGGWFAAPAPEARRSFARKYEAMYGVQPPRIASLGYDAVSLVATLARGEPFRRYTDQALTDPNGFSGVDGVFRFHEDGSAERGLAIVEVQPTGFTLVEPAPTTFQPVGF